MKNALFYRLLMVMSTLLFTGSAARAATDTQQIKKVTAEINDNGVQKVEVAGGGYFYDPNYIIVKVNVPVELVVVSKESGFIPHDIAMHWPEAGIDFRKDLSTTPNSITFTPTKVGTYPFYCSKKFLFFESHREKGMEGTLEVRE